MSSPRLLTIHRLGRVEYEDGLVLQAQLARARKAGLIPDALLLLEHPPVVTLGRGARAGHVLAPTELLVRRGVTVHETDRGGDVTYHGPGQIVGYPILELSGERRDVRAYVRSVEEGMLRALEAFGVRGRRIPRWPGVWLGEEGRDARKIGALGVHIARWITTHGFALNVAPALEDFELILPCGIAEAGVTSLGHELGRAPRAEAVEAALVRAYAEIWQAEAVEAAARVQTVSVAITRSTLAGPEVLLLHRTAERGGFWQLVTGRREPGEPALDAAAREVEEETGRRLEVRSLAYRHAFALGSFQPPVLAEEEAFAARWEGDGAVRLGPEHDDAAWVGVAAALERLPWAGLRRAVQRACRPPPDPAWR